MRFSPSSINTLSKCGYKYYLEKVEGHREPGKKKYAALQGDIVADAIQAGILKVIEQKSITEAELTELLVDAYTQRFEQARIDSVVLDPIITLLREGLSEMAMKEVDQYAMAINSSDYEIKLPPPLKGGGVSKSKTKPPLSMMVYGTMENLLWFFSNANPVYPLLFMAKSAENELPFEVAVGQPYTVVINGQAVQEEDILNGRFDVVLTMHDGSRIILELKYTKTAYTQILVDKARQMLSYQYALRDVSGEAWLVDVNHQRAFRANKPAQLELIIETLVRAARQMVSGQIFMPKCGSDPFTDNSVLCGFKGCALCPFSTGEPTSDE